MKLPANIAALTPLMRGVTSAYVVSGAVHLVRPATFEDIVPRELPRKRELVYASGVAELACAAGLLTPRARPAAGLASAALLVAVLPGNVEMARQAYERMQRKGATPQRQAFFAGTVLRVVGQWPLIRASLRTAGR